MKNTLLSCFFLLLFSLLSFSQQKAYNKEFQFEIIKNTELLPKKDSLRALIVNFENGDLSNFCQTLKNNPQLKEIQLFRAPQSAIDSLSRRSGDSIMYLFIKEYEENALTLQAFPELDLLWIESNTMRNLDISKAVLDKLYILSVDSESMKEWKTQSHFPELGLIDLDAPLLEEFGIESAPRLGQFSYYCSFNALPSFLCECEELLFISFENFKNIEIDACFEQKVFDGHYSNITIRDGMDGPIVVEWLSKDRQ